jgi:uncharacterized membrane protein YccC
VAARLPASPAGLSRGPELPGRAPGRVARRAGRRFLADLGGGRSFLAAELRQSGWLDFGAFRWRDLAVGQSVRTTLGVLAPLIVGAASGHLEYGSYAALGALPAGFVSFRGVSWTRVLAVLAATSGMAVSTFAGATAAYSLPWLLVLLVFCWAYLVGLLASLGPTVLAVSLQWPVALLIGSALPLAPADAAVRACLVLAGGLWQCLLVITSWAVNRGSAERTALAESYEALARYAADVAAGSQGPPSPDQLAGSTVLADPNPLLRTAPRQHMLDLAQEAERIRATLTALAADSASSGPGASALLRATAEVLTEISAGIGGPRAELGGHLTAARHGLDGISTEAGATWQWAGEALLGQLRSACRLAARMNDAEQGRAGADSPPLLRPDLVRDARLTVRASLGPSAEAGRHALRLAVVSAIAEVIAIATDLPHGYWAALTIFIVLRPDYSSTFYRGLQRAAGTVVGAGLGVATALLGRVSTIALLIGIGISLLAAFAVFTVNYLLYSVFLTDFVVVLLAMLGLPPDTTAVDRLIGTGVGTGLAILAYLLWPTWAGTSAAENFALLYLAQGTYGGAELRAYTRPGAGAELDQLQLAARRARIDAEAAADRLAGEPAHGAVGVSLAVALESAGYRIAQALLTLVAATRAHHAAMASERDQPDPDAALQPQLDRLAADVQQATETLASWLRELGASGVPPALPPLPDLRRELRAMWTPGEASTLTPSSVARGGLFTGADALIDAINSAAHAMREQAARP